MVGHHVAVLGEPLLAESAESILLGDLPVEELPHFAVGPKFPVSPGIPAESHDVLLIGLGAMVGLGWAGNEIARFSDWKRLRSPFSQGLNAEPGGGVAGEDLPGANVPGEHLGRLVAGLAHDVALADSVHCGLGDASGAQRVAAQRLRLQTGAAGGALQDPADAVLVEAAAGGPAMAVNSAECGTIDDAGTGQPAAQGADRAGCLLLPKGNADFAAGRSSSGGDQ